LLQRKHLLQEHEKYMYLKIKMNGKEFMRQNPSAVNIAGYEFK